jgi:branched-chain amino acid transport system substrate-binding protein
MALVLGAAACTGGADTEQVIEPVSTTVVADSVAPVVDDAVLRIGMLVPLSGPGAELGGSLRDGIRLAVQTANQAGGVLGAPIEVALVADEGPDVATARRATDKLVRAGVDVVIGPASSVVAPIVLPLLHGAGVAACSPTASSIALDDFPDDRLFVRTIPSDSLQATAIAQAIDLTGERAASVVYLDDDYGRPFAQRLAEDLRRLSIEVRQLLPVMADDTDFADDARLAAGGGIGVVAVVGDPTTGPRVVESLFGELGDDAQVIVNDAMRVPATAGAYARLRVDQLDRLSGVSPRASVAPSDFSTSFAEAHPGERELFAAHAADCVNVLALAARAAGSTTAADLMRQLEDVTSGGTRCSSFTACATLQDDGRNIDYDGPSGQLRLDATGDPARGVFEVFRYDPTGRDVADSLLVVPR